MIAFNLMDQIRSLFADGRKHGPALALLSAALFGLSTPLAKLLLGKVNPWFLAGLLYLGAGMGLALLALSMRLSGKRAPEAPIGRRELPWLAAAILIGGVIAPLLLMFGLQRTSATATSLLLNLESLATLSFAWLIFREQVDRGLLLGAGCILFGAVVLAWPDGSSSIDPLGGFLVAGACLAWGLDNNLTRKVSSADPLQIAMLRGLVAGSVNLAVASAFSDGVQVVSPLPILAALATGFLGYGVSLYLFVLALRMLGTARVGAYFATAPFLGAIAAVPLLGDVPTWPLLLSGFLMAFGVWLHLTERHGHAHLHEESAHAHRHRHDAHHQHEHGPSDPKGKPHSHWHRHPPMLHAHLHYPDLHHRHRHSRNAFGWRP